VKTEDTKWYDQEILSLDRGEKVGPDWRGKSGTFKEEEEDVVVQRKEASESLEGVQ